MNTPYQYSDISSYISVRDGEKKIGEAIEFKSLKDFKGSYVLLGIREHFGVLANNGKPGAENAWQAFLSSFLNIQNNQFIDSSNILIEGEVDIRAFSNDNDLNLNDKVNKIDQLVSERIKNIKSAGKTPIFIGGGHNNAYPIIKGASLALNSSIDVLNIDAHADLRERNGRHSGNPFSYALHENYLNHYFVHGLHEPYNNQFIINQFNNNPQLSFKSYEAILRNQETINQSISDINNHLQKKRIGLEIDLDVITNMPSSAQTPSGFSLEYIRMFIHQLRQHYTFEYVHLCEGAPTNEKEKIVVGKALSYLVQDLIKE